MSEPTDPDSGATHDPTADADGPVPVFGTWPRIYLAVVVWAVIVMALVWVFSSRTL